MRLGKEHYLFETCPQLHPEVLKLEWLHDSLLHYRNQQNLGIMDKPNWFQEALLVARAEVDMIQTEKQNKPKAEFKKPGRGGFNG